MLPIPKDSGTFWTEYNDLRIRISYGIYDSHISVSASYYIWENESIVGFCKHTHLRMALKGAIKSLLNEMEEWGMDIWVSTRPKTNQKAKLSFFKLRKTLINRRKNYTFLYYDNILIIIRSLINITTNSQPFLTILKEKSGYCCNTNPCHMFYILCASILSISSNSSLEKVRLFNAFTFSSTCSTLLAPIKAEVTRPSRNTQARAICARLCPRSAARSFSCLTRFTTSTVT